MAKKNVNRAKQYKHQNRHVLKKAVATVTAAVKEAPKKVESYKSSSKRSETSGFFSGRVCCKFGRCGT